MATIVVVLPVAADVGGLIDLLGDRGYSVLRVPTPAAATRLVAVLDVAFVLIRCLPAWYADLGQLCQMVTTRPVTAPIILLWRADLDVVGPMTTPPGAVMPVLTVQQMTIGIPPCLG